VSLVIAVPLIVAGAIVFDQLYDRLAGRVAKSRA
jgi:hypothetical protein